MACVEAEKHVSVPQESDDDDGHEGFSKEDRRRGVHAGYRSKNKATKHLAHDSYTGSAPPPWYHRQGESRYRPEDQFAVFSRSGVPSQLQLGNESLLVNGSNPSNYVYYSLNKNRRWEMLDNLDQLTQIDEKGDPVLRAAKDDDSSSSPSSTVTADSAIYVFERTQTVSKDYGFKQRQRYAEAERPEPDGDAEAEFTYTLVKGRKGTTVVKKKNPHYSKPAERTAEMDKMADSQYMVSIERSKQKHQKPRLHKRSDNKQYGQWYRERLHGGSRAHKHEFNEQLADVM